MLEHPALRQRYLLAYARLHWEALMEVLTMRELTLEQIGWTEEKLRQFVEVMGEERIVRSLGKERVLELLGEEEVRRWLEEKERKNGKALRKRGRRK
ncbi:MAG: hypothetical protein RMK49_12215 [Abditibacteriales bacterium]|nr:hypothetical protein [Abditibacteriales bacterium]MDW8366600.1 hypothetical protein [Abditibacteriales bacterium]